MRIVRDERAFTAIELLVASTIFIAVLGATLRPLDTFWGSNRRTTQQSEAQQRARETVDRLANDVRDISGQTQLVEKAAASDIVFKITDPKATLGANADNEKRVRYCLSGTTLIRQEYRWTTAAPPALPSTSACPGTAPWTVQDPLSSATFEPIAANVANGSTPLFTYDTATAANVGRVDIDLKIDTTLAVDTKPGATHQTAELKTTVVLRNVNQAPLATFTATPTGSKHVILDASAAYDPEGTSLTYRWCLVSGCSSASAIGTTSSLDYVAASTGSQTFYLDVWDAGGIMAESSQTVVVT